MSLCPAQRLDFYLLFVLFVQVKERYIQIPNCSLLMLKVKFNQIKKEAVHLECTFGQSAITFCFCFAKAFMVPKRCYYYHFLSMLALTFCSKYHHVIFSLHDRPARMAPDPSHIHAYHRLMLHKLEVKKKKKRKLLNQSSRLRYSVPTIPIMQHISIFLLDPQCL